MNATGFTLNNFLIFLIEFGFSILFLVIFSCIHYGITRSTKLGKKIEKSKMWNFWYFFIFGFILSLICFIVSSVSTIAIGDIGMPLTILGLIYAMTIFYNRSVQVGAIVPTILWILYEYNGFTSFNFDWLLRLIMVLVMAIIAFATTYIQAKKVWPKFLISCLITTILCIIILVCVVNENTGFYCVILLISIASTIFYFAIIKYINKVLTKVSQLAKQGVYADKHYLIPTVLGQYFNEFIKTHNVSQAIVVSLLIKVDDKHKEQLLDNIHRSFKKDKCLMFKSSDNLYGLILTGKDYHIQDLNLSFNGNNLKDRLQIDNLKFLETKLKHLMSKDINIKAYVSIYGVHSCDLNQLLTNNQYLIRHDDVETNHNIIQLFNTNMTYQEINNNIAYTTLTQKVNLNDINVELELIKLNKNHKIYVCPRFYWPKLLTCDINTIMNQFDSATADTLLRSLAIKSIELYVNHPDYRKYQLLIYYPIDSLNSNTWSCSNFIKKIKLYGISINDIILSFNVNKFRYWPKQVVANLQSLEQYHLNYFLVDVTNIQGLSSLHPQAIILANKNQTNIKLSKKYNFNIL